MWSGAERCQAQAQWLEMVKVCGDGGGSGGGAGGVEKVAEDTGNIREKRKYGRIAAGQATRVTKIVYNDRLDHI